MFSKQSRFRAGRRPHRSAKVTTCKARSAALLSGSSYCRRSNGSMPATASTYSGSPLLCPTCEKVSSRRLQPRKDSSKGRARVRRTCWSSFRWSFSNLIHDYLQLALVHCAAGCVLRLRMRFAFTSVIPRSCQCGRTLRGPQRGRRPT